MNSEKVKEIKKALEFNAKDDFCYLPYIDDKDKQNTVKFADILTYINELESENERLEKQCVDWNNLYHKKLDQNQQLKDRIAELEKENEILRKAKTIDDNVVNEMRNLLKQFAERLKEISCEMYLKEQLHRCIDQTLKECIK